MATTEFIPSVGLYESRSLDRIKRDMKRMRNRKLFWASLFTLIFILAVVLFNWAGGLVIAGLAIGDVIQLICVLMGLFSGIMLFIYAVAILPDRFSSGFSKTERLNWYLDRLCVHLQTYAETEGKGFSRILARATLYAASRLFPEWSWDESRKESVIDNDLFQEEYLRLSFVLRDIFQRLNYLLFRKREIPAGIIKVLGTFRESLDVSSGSPNVDQIGDVGWMAANLRRVEGTGIDKDMFFALLRATAVERYKRAVYGNVYAMVIIAW
ncbi:MAG: hypothetical protein LN415_04215, partial [Candidatus Thermoplasmatota archaeon]|nr:hypothetical protein [Candidatus Thermoplasmatota archaeon]